MKNFDLAILGGGPAGYTAAERAAVRGLRVVVFETRELGGVCLNEGCIPTKTLLYSAKTYTNALAADKYGVITDGVDFDFGRIAARKNKVVRKLVLGVAAKMKQHKIEVVKEFATIKNHTKNSSENRTENCFEICDEKGEKYIAKNLLISTGAESFVPPMIGATENAITSREILALKELPASIVIIGGGVVGMEFACLFGSLGVKVSVVEVMDEIMPGIDLEISAMLRRMMEKKGIEFHLSSRCESIENGRVNFINSSGEKHSVDGEKIVVSAGRKPIVKGFGLENLGVELTAKGGIKTDERMRTNIAGVWAAGDVTGFSMLAHTASREAEVAVNDIVSGGASAKTPSTDTMRYDAIAGVVYTNPEIATVGLTADAARAKGLKIKELKLPMSYSGRFVAENEGGDGICKIVIDEADDRVLGVHLLGGPAGEIIWGAALAIEQKMTLRELQRTVFPHPTVSEIIKETAFQSGVMS